MRKEYEARGLKSAIGTKAHKKCAFTLKVWAVQKALYLVPLTMIEPILKILQKEIDEVTREQVKVNMNIAKYKKEMLLIIRYIRNKYEKEGDSISWLV